MSWRGVKETSGTCSLAETREFVWTGTLLTPSRGDICGVQKWVCRSGPPAVWPSYWGVSLGMRGGRLFAGHGHGGWGTK
jgi:hypothetical protein